MRNLTDEDRAAWFDWQVNRRRDWPLWAALESRSFVSDANDADIMLYAQEHSMRAGFFNDAEWIDIRGNWRRQ